MVKMDAIEINDRMEVTPVESVKATCMDCLYWYRCRRGEIDCLLRPLRSTMNTIRA